MIKDSVYHLEESRDSLQERQTGLERRLEVLEGARGDRPIAPLLSEPGLPSEELEAVVRKAVAVAMATAGLAAPIPGALQERDLEQLRAQRKAVEELRTDLDSRA